ARVWGNPGAGVGAGVCPGLTGTPCLQDPYPLHPRPGLTGKLPARGGIAMPRLLIATALLVLMAPPAFARLEIENLEACYGQFGPARKVLDYYPNDTIFFRFTVKGARADPEGNCDAEVTWKILDGSGKELVVMRMPAKGPQPCFGCDHFPVWLSGPVPQAIA